jgi:hypothetical protein
VVIFLWILALTTYYTSLLDLYNINIYVSRSVVFSTLSCSMPYGYLSIMGV